MNSRRCNASGAIAPCIVVDRYNTGHTNCRRSCHLTVLPTSERDARRAAPLVDRATHAVHRDTERVCLDCHAGRDDTCRGEITARLRCTEPLHRGAAGAETESATGAGGRAVQFSAPCAMIRRRRAPIFRFWDLGA